MDNPSLAGHILLEVFDDDIGKDDLLGVVAIPTADILRGRKMTRHGKDFILNRIYSHFYRAWFPLDQAKSGEVCVSMEFRMTPAARAGDTEMTETRKKTSVSSASSNDVSATKKSSSASLYHR